MRDFELVALLTVLMRLPYAASAFMPGLRSLVIATLATGTVIVFTGYHFAEPCETARSGPLPYFPDVALLWMAALITGFFAALTAIGMIFLSAPPALTITVRLLGVALIPSVFQAMQEAARMNGVSLSMCWG